MELSKELQEYIKNQDDEFTEINGTWYHIDETENCDDCGEAHLSNTECDCREDSGDDAAWDHKQSIMV